jgi:NADPH:quinone reductase-like Zn-dependent oxidoreductase
MKAALLTDYGDVDRLEVRDVPEPSPGKDEVKLRVAAGSINRFDVKLRTGSVKSWMPIQFPYILGFDGSGEVVEIGPDVSGIEVGDRVLGLVKRSHAAFAVAPANALAVVPPELDLIDAGSLPVVALTGAQLVEEAVAPRKGDLLLITGALGSVGRAGVYAARALGARVIAGVRATQLAEAQKLGVESAVALDDAAALERLGPLDAVADTVGGEVVSKLLPRLKPGGTWASVVGKPAGAKERGIVVHSIQTHPDSTRLAALAGALLRGELLLPIAGRFPLGQVREAHRMAERGGTGKVLVLP